VLSAADSKTDKYMTDAELKRSSASWLRSAPSRRDGAAREHAGPASQGVSGAPDLERFGDERKARPQAVEAASGVEGDDRAE
jgi:hypothetical protein